VGGANLAQLDPYTVTQAKLDALDKARLRFQDAKSKPRAKVGEKAGFTATLPQMIRDTKSLLRTRLDKLMNTFRLTDPPFFAGYQAPASLWTCAVPERPPRRRSRRRQRRRRHRGLSLARTARRAGLCFRARPLYSRPLRP
jgi:hypothetical protein